MSTSSENPTPQENDSENQAKNMTYGSKRLKMAQAQVNEVIDVMKVNVDKVMERENQLSNLDHRADVLQAGASQFQQSSRSLRQKYWWQNVRMMIILAAIAIVFILIIVIWISN